MHLQHSSLLNMTAADRAIKDLFGARVPQQSVATACCMHRLEGSDCALELWQVRPQGDRIAWTMAVQWPNTASPCPVLLSPDGCWPHVLNHEATLAVVREGVALAWFNRTELAFDAPNGQCLGPVFEHWPDLDLGAISVWAWGLQRCADVLLQCPGTNAQKLGVIGHSRGGKAALLAGASDPRFSATVSHNSGTAGAASLQCQGKGAESLDELAERYPHWLSKACGHKAVRQELVAIDATTLLMSGLAPRGLCLLQARDDAWANPEGTRHAHERLRPHWAAHHAGHRLQLHERDGGHPMTVLDWQRAARFLRDLH